MAPHYLLNMPSLTTSSTPLGGGPEHDGVIEPAQVHAKVFLSDDILIHYAPEDNNPQYFDTNKYGLFWALCASVTVTSNVVTRIDKRATFPKILGHASFETSPFVLSFYEKNAAAINNIFHDAIRKNIIELHKYSRLHNLRLRHVIKLPESF